MKVQACFDHLVLLMLNNFNNISALPCPAPFFPPFIALILLNYLMSQMIHYSAAFCSFPLLIRTKRKQKQHSIRSMLSRKQRRLDRCPPSCLQSKCCMQLLSLPDALLSPPPSLSRFLSLLPSSKKGPCRTKPQHQHLA